jgi:hypothetical protein
MKLILTGDVNLMNVTDPSVPFARVADELREAVLLHPSCSVHFAVGPARAEPALALWQSFAAFKLDRGLPP